MTDETVDVQVFPGEKIQHVTWVDSFGWTCVRCGWLGTGLLSAEAAMQEAHDHIKRNHPELETAYPRPGLRASSGPSDVRNGDPQSPTE